MATLEAGLVPSEFAREIRSAASRYGMEQPRIFGSTAMGASRAGSDLDLLVRLGPGRGYQDLLDFCDELERALGRRVDVVPEDGLSPFLRDRVLAEAIPV